MSDVILSEADAHLCMWASTANRKGGVGKNIRINLLQENRNKDIKRPLKQWVLTRKTRQLIGLVEPLGVKDTVQNFDHQVGKTNPSTTCSHKSSDIDERTVLNDLRDLKLFDSTPNCKHDSFQDMSADPLATLDQVDWDKWLKKHKRNLMLDAPLMKDEEDEL